MSTKPSIAVLGGMNVDIQGKCFGSFKAGDSNPGSLVSFPGGVGRNIAENLALLGARVELVSVLGDDPAAVILESSCRSAGIGLEGTLRLEGRDSCQYLCLLDADGSLAGAIAAMEAMDLLTPDRLEEVAGLLDSAELILVDANIPEASIRWLAARYPRGRKRPLLGFDPVSVQKAGRGAASLGAFDFAKPNRAEAALLAGFNSSSSAGAAAETGAEAGMSAPALAAALRARGLGEAFISLGSEGLLAVGPGAKGRPELWTATLPRSLDVSLARRSSSGAGDAACSAIAWGLLAGLDLGRRCAIALAAAMVAAASDSPVNPSMSAALLLETAKGIECERIS